MAVSKEVIFQGLKQLFGVPIIYISHGFHLPKNSQCSKLKYHLPFNGEWTVVNGGCEKQFSHSWNVPTQRYAYDFLIMNEEGKTYQGNNEDVTSYSCYGKEVLAPADGIVVGIGNICGDEKPFVNNEINAMAKDIRGNYILIQHAKKEYGFLGHLKPQSIAVEIGQTVKQGQPIARCGNSGNTSEPHVHFHLQDGIGFFTSAGIPITFENIKVSKQNSYSNYDDRAIPEITVSSQSEQHIARGQQVTNT